MPLNPNPQTVFWPGQSWSGSGTASLDGTNSRQGFRVLPPRAVSFDTAWVRGSKSGTTTGFSLDLHVQTEASGLPSGSDVTNGAVTGTAPWSSGWQSFATPGTVSLAANAPSWFTFVEGAGTWTSSNKMSFPYIQDNGRNVQPSHQNAAYPAAGPGPWALASTTFNRTPALVLTLAGAVTWAQPYNTQGTRAVQGTTRVGLRFHADVPATLSGFVVCLSAAAGASDLTAKVYSAADALVGTGTSLSLANAWGGFPVGSSYPAYFDFGDLALAAGDYWLSLLQSDTANANNWLLTVLQGDYPTSGESLSRGGTAWQVGTRAGDTGAWSVPSPFEDATFGPVYNGQAAGSGGGGLLLPRGMNGGFGS